MDRLHVDDVVCFGGMKTRLKATFRSMPLKYYYSGGLMFSQCRHMRKLWVFEVSKNIFQNDVTNFFN